MSDSDFEAGRQAERERWIEAVKRLEEEHAYGYLDELLKYLEEIPCK